MTYRYPSSDTGWGLFRAEDAAAARDAINLTKISVLDFISDPSNTASHQAGFEAAIAAAIVGDGYEIVIPAGDWYVEGLVIPKKAPLKFRGHGAAHYAQRSESTIGVTLGTRLIRTGDLPIIIGIGGKPPTVTTSITDNNDVYVEWTDLVRDVVFEDLTFENQNETATTPMIDLRAAGGLRFNRCVFFSATQTSTMLELTAVMDSSFSFCYVLGGSVSLRVNDGTDVYWATNAVWFNSCDFENYGESGIDIGDDTSTHPQVPRLIRFSDHKMEGPTTSGDNPAIILQHATGIYFDQAYVAHHNVTGPIMDVRRVNGVYGDIGFISQYYETYVEPSARIEFSVNAHLVDLDVYVHSGPDSSVNVITQDDVNDSTINCRINGLSRKVNGGTRPNRWDFTRTVFQVSDTSVNQYGFTTANRNSWYIGNPSNPSTDIEEFSVTAVAASGDVLKLFKLRSYGHTSGKDPSTATYRDLQLSGFLNLSNTTLGWVNFQNLSSVPAAPVGGHRLYSVSDNLTWDGVPLATTTGTETFTNKTLTSPVLNNAKVDVLYSGSTPVAQFAAPSSGNYFYINSSSSNPSIQVVGSSTDISVNFVPRGAGTLSIFVGTGQTPTLEARGADTNHDLKLLPKGSGIVRSGTDPMGVKVAVPASGTAAGKPGQWAADANYIYAYTGDGSTHSWVRSATTAW